MQGNLAKTYQEIVSMLKISKELFTSWNDAGLLYCHWKSNEHLLPGLDGDTDLDVLLSRDGQQKGEAILHELDFLQCKSQYGSRYPNVDDWIGFDKETGKLIHLHLHYAIVTGHKGLKEYELPWAERALRTRILDEEYGVYIMEPNLEMVTLYTRIGLKAGLIEIVRCFKGSFKFPKDTQREIDWLRERVDVKEVYRILAEYYGKDADAVNEIMSRGNINSDSYLKLRKIAENNFKNYSRVKHFMRLRELSYLLYHICLKRILKRLKPIISKKVPISEKGLTVAFLGQDGAGKTTVTKNLIKWWSWKMDVRYVYLGSGENYFSFKKSLSHKLPPKGVFKYFRAMLGLSVLSDVAKLSYKNVLKAEKYASKGGLVIFDRFPQTKYMSICDGPKLRKKVHDYFGAGILSKMFAPMIKTEEKYIGKTVTHTPDVVIKLTLTPEESIRRKPHENYEAVKQKHEIVKSLEFKGCDVYTIDATMPFDEELIMIKNIIWQHIQK